MKLEHLAINVADPQAIAKWYVENLDMVIMRASDEPPYMTFVADKDKASMIEIYGNSEAEVPDYAAIPPLTFHLAFLASDIESKRDALLAAGATLAGDLNETPAGDRLLFLRDPWGIPLQLVQRKEPML